MKQKKIYEVIVFKTQGIRQRRTAVPEKQETMEVRPPIVPAYYRERVFRVQERQGTCRAWRKG